MELMTENEIAVKFEEILNEMNLTEEKKKPLRIMSIDMKKNMLEMHWKSEQVNQSRSKFVHPADYINYLINSNETSNYSKLCSCMESLRIALTNNPVSWVQDFGDNNGLNAIVMILNKCYSTNNHHRFKLQHECIKCLKPFMNNTAGLKRAFNDKDAFTLLARSINPQLPHIMIDAVKLMAVVCLIPPIGLNKVLEAITRSAQLIQGDAYDRFTPIIEGLKITDNEPLRASCMQLINAILANIDDLDFRLHIRNEMMRTGLCDILESLPSESEFSISTVSSELMIQMKVFNEHKDEDLDELTSRYDAIRFDLDDITDCFQLIHNSIKNSPSEPYLLSILQHLLLIRDDPYAKPAYYRLIEECVSQIILNKNGCDPDFRHGKKIQIDVDYVIDHIVERSKAEEEKNNTELCQKLEESLTAKQESEAKVLQLQTKVQEYERQLNEIKIKISNNSNATANNLNNDSNNNSNIPFGSSNNIPRTLGQGKAITATGAIPPPPPPPPPPSINSSSSSIPPPPPPPPPPSLGTTRFSSTTETGQPPPPPPPPPLGSGPPLPPPPFGGFQPLTPQLPPGLKPKKVYKHDFPIKRANWRKITPTKISEKSFWVDTNEDALASEDIFDGLSSKFTSDPRSTSKKVKNDEHTDKLGTVRKTKELKVLDSKAAQNLMILLSSSKVTAEELADHILSMNEEHLTDAIIQQLIKYMPTPQQLTRLEEFRNDFNNLYEAEQFALTLGSIKRLEARLKSTCFKIKFNELIQDIKPDIVTATAACEEVKKSKRFATILKLILLVGNYMNSGSRNGQAFGFEISFLPKLISTKAYDNRTTLLHFLTEIVENKHPDCINFYEDIHHVDRASRVSPEQIVKNLNSMRKSISDVEVDLRNFKPHNDKDRFGTVMTTFLKDAKEQFELLESMYAKLDRLYNDLGQFYVFEPKTYTLDEFFGDIKTFKDQFIESYKENLKIREEEEKKRRAKEAKNRAEKEKAERQLKKLPLVDIEKDQEGFMDSLIKTLETGSAFAQKTRRRQQRPHGPNGKLYKDKLKSRLVLINC